MIRIVHVITGLDSGGAEAMLYKLLAAEGNAELDSSVISLTTLGTMGPRIREMGVPVMALGMRANALDVVQTLHLAHLLEEINPDIIQTWMYHANLIGAVAGKIAGRIPVVWGVRAAGEDFDGYPAQTVLVAKGSAVVSHYLPSRIVVNSEAARRNHAALGYERQRMVVIPNGFDTALFKPDPRARREIRTALGIPEDAVVIGLVARFHPQKNHLSFVEAASFVARREPDVRFLLCGTGVTWENEALASRIGETEAPQRFRLLGNRGDVERITASFDIACSSSNSESFSNTIGEAMACGVPCVVTDVGDSAPIVGATGLVVPVRDPAALGTALLRMIELGTDERAKLGKAARERIVTGYSIGAIAQAYVRLYEGVLGA